MRKHSTELISRLLVAALVAGTFAVAASTMTGCGGGEEEVVENPMTDEIVGTWFAYRDNTIDNMWTFRRDGTCVNDGWPEGSTISAALPYELEGTYEVLADRIVAEFTVSLGDRDTTVTYTLEEPAISGGRLVYNAGDIPLVFLRERAAVAGTPDESSETAPVDPELGAKVVGSWVAFVDHFPSNTWEFKGDGTFVNEGWGRMGPTLVRRLYRTTGTYEATGPHLVLANEQIRQFDPETAEQIAAYDIAERIVLYNVDILGNRMVYTNEVGLPQVFRTGVVTPTNW